MRERDEVITKMISEINIYIYQFSEAKVKSMQANVQPALCKSSKFQAHATRAHHDFKTIKIMITM